MVHFTTATTAPVPSVSDVTLANGVRLNYTHAGPNHGEAIVLLHGYSDSAFSFSRIMPLLPPHVRVIAPDLRGHGASDRPTRGYRIADLADDVIQMMDALQVPRVLLVGHSMGSFVAQALAERAAHCLSGLVLVGSAPTPATATVFELQNAVERFGDSVDPEFVRAFQYSSIAQPVPEAFMEAAVANSVKMPADIWRLVLRGLIEFIPRLPRPNVRVLVIGGDQDSVFSAEEQTALAAQYVGSELEIVKGVGHTLQWEQPEVFAQKLMRFAR